MVRLTLLGEVHCHHDGVSSLSGEGMQHEGHHVSCRLFIFCMETTLILTDLLFIHFYVCIHREETVASASYMWHKAS